MMNNQEQQGRIDGTNEINDGNNQTSTVSTSTSTSSVRGSHGDNINTNQANVQVRDVDDSGSRMLMTRRRLQEQEQDVLQDTCMIPTNGRISTAITTINNATDSLFDTHRPTPAGRVGGEGVGVRAIGMLRSLPYRMDTTPTITITDDEGEDVVEKPTTVPRVSSWGKLDLLAVLEQVEQILDGNDEDDRRFGYNDDDTWKEFCRNLPLQ